MKLKRLKINFDWSLVFIPLILAICSVATIYSITSISGKTSLVVGQITYFAIAIAVYTLALLFDYRRLKNYSWYFYLIGVGSLIALTFFGQTVLGAKRWIDLGFTQVQPSEVMKLFALIFSAYFLSRIKDRKWTQIAFYIILITIPIVLVLRQPDLGTALTISVIVIASLIAAGIPKKFFLIAALILIALTPLAWTRLQPYQKQRVTSFVDPSSDPQKSGYNVNQSKIAVGSGGLYGKGFSGATQSQLQFLPIAQIDFIFSGWAEATGFVGSIVLVCLYAILIWRMFAISNLARDNFGRIFALGAGSMILFQSFVNIGMNIGIMPVTGIPLPFVSYGGTSVIVNAALFGIIQSIYLRREALRFD